MKKGIPFTRVEIDLSALEFNFNQLRKQVGARTRIMVVVKADAYGHGMPAVASRLRRLGVDYLGVARPEEAFQLKKHCVDAPVLILNAILPVEVPEVVRYDWIQTVGSGELALALDREARRQKKTVSVHVKVDTGMGRFGIWYKEAPVLVRDVLRLPNVRLAGICTHFPSADCDREFTRLQIGRFRRLIENLEKEGIVIPEKHAANSAGVVGFKDSHLTMVRPGIMIYGMLSVRGRYTDIILRPVLSFKSKISFLKQVGSRRSISYGRTHFTRKKTTIAIVPVGYAHGYPRGLSNHAHMLVRGVRVPVVGRVCMDQTMIDVGRVGGVKTGDEVVLIGEQKDERVTCEELAHLAGTIPYEIVCGISGRIPRIYKNKGIK